MASADYLQAECGENHGFCTTPAHTVGEFPKQSALKALPYSFMTLTTTSECSNMQNLPHFYSTPIYEMHNTLSIFFLVAPKLDPTRYKIVSTGSATWPQLKGKKKKPKEKGYAKKVSPPPHTAMPV